MSAAESLSDDLSDEQLLLRYRTANDQAAFAILVRRHRQLVLGVCRQALGHWQDAEDAFQATFVVLAKDARRIRKPTALANWLYGVAHRISLQVRRRRARNRTIEIQDQMVDRTALSPLDHLARRYQQGVAYDELARLPDRLRTPMVLRYLSGKSNKEIAQQLRLTEAAVEGRLKRAKSKLRVQLTGHGVTLSVALATLVADATTTAAAESTTLLNATIDRCLACHSNVKPVSAEAAEIVQLANQEIIAMTTLKAVKLGIFGAAALCATALTFTLDQFATKSWASDPFGTTETVQVESPLAEDSPFGVEGEVRVEVDDDPSSDNPPVATDAAAHDPFTQLDAFLKTDPEVANSDANDPFAASPGDPAADDPFAATPRGGANPASIENPFAAKPPGAAGPAADDPYAEGQVKAIDLKRRSPAVKRIESALSMPVKFDFFDEPIQGVAQFISQVHGVQIVIDKLALEEDGVTTDAPVTIRLSGIPLRSALNLTLGQLRLDYVIQDEVLLITSRTKAETILDTRLYPHQSSWQIDQEELVQCITSCIAPNSWSEVGGEGFISNYRKGLIIRQTDRVHAEIANLLRQFSLSESAAD